jgi:hypothetical protein
MTKFFRPWAAPVAAMMIVALVAAPALSQKKAAPAAPAAMGGGATPEATFKQAQAAAEKDDWKGLLGNMTVESQEMFAGSMAMVGVMMQAFAGLGGEEGAAAAKDIKKALDKHGLTDGVLEKLEGEAGMDPEKAIKALVKPVKDRGQFVADMMVAMKKMKGFKDKTPISKDATLMDLKTTGDTAKGTIEFTQEGEKKTEPIAFKKVKGKWYMDITEAMKEAFKGGGEGGPGGLPGAGPLE